MPIFILFAAVIAGVAIYEKKKSAAAAVPGAQSAPTPQAYASPTYAPGGTVDESPGTDDDPSQVNSPITGD